MHAYNSTDGCTYCCTYQLVDLIDCLSGLTLKERCQRHGEHINMYVHVSMYSFMVVDHKGADVLAVWLHRVDDIMTHCVHQFVGNSKTHRSNAASLPC